MLSYEEKYINLLRKLLTRGFKLEDSTVSLHSTVRLDLNDYIPLLHSTHVDIGKINDSLNILIEAIPESLFLGLGSSYFKPVTLFNGVALPNVSCVVDENKVLCLSATVYEAHVIDEVPQLIPMFFALAKYISNNFDYKLGTLVITFNFISLPVKDESRAKKLLQNNVKITALDHPYKRYALQDVWNNTTFKVPNYKVGKSSFEAV